MIFCRVVPRRCRRTGLSCCASSRCASLPFGLPSLAQVNGIASGGLTATALPPFAAGELQGSGAAMSAGVCLRGLLKVNGGLTWGMAPCGNPPPSGRVSGGEPSRIKIGTLKGPPIFSWTVQQLRGDVAKNKFTICKYCWMNRARFTIITNRNRALRPHGHPP